MSIRCTECKGKVYDAAGITRAEIKHIKVQEGPGYIVCQSHIDLIKESLQSLEQLTEGIVFVVDKRTGYQNPCSKALAWTEPTPRTAIQGYLSLSYIQGHFPSTYAFILNSLLH